MTPPAGAPVPVVPPVPPVPPVRVLVVEDDEIAASAHAEYVRRLAGFELAGVARDGRESIRQLRDPTSRIDLVLLDMNLPDTHGLELCRHIRASGIDVDVIAITAVRDVSVVRSSVALGIVQYLIKPFTFAAFSDRLRSYLEFRASFVSGSGLASQLDVDQGLSNLRTATRAPLAKGLSDETLAKVSAYVKHSGAGLSAGEVSAELDLSRVTARRYLEYLVEAGLVARDARYGTPGRPELEYRWLR